VVRPCHLKLLAALKQRLIINFPFFLNAMLHEVDARTQKAKYHVTIISHHGLVKLIVNRALIQTQITWGDLIEADMPLQIEQIEIHQETPSQRIETAHEEGGRAQIETPLPQPKIDAKTQKNSPATKETVVQNEQAFQSPEQGVIINRLEVELVQTQQTLTQCRSEMVNMEEHQNFC
jgi:hypothetical protein